jgi:hypothetical protein
MDKESLLEKFKDLSSTPLVEALGIEVTDFGDRYICGKMPVDQTAFRTASWRSKRCPF